MPTGGGEPRKVTDEPYGVSEPVWSPDSRRLALVGRVPEEGRYGENKPEKERSRRITGFKYRRDNLGFFLDRRAAGVRGRLP
ncbi:hypothetical protein ACIBQ1_14125 [Nonomuraea sp. NPDC050153]|uniref:hypothetical protein n=1 Tax=Nonomuraea sp. NPDC050153 TaxID=3364359 RepID=UPI0037B56D00